MLFNLQGKTEDIAGVNIFLSLIIGASLSAGFYKRNEMREMRGMGLVSLLLCGVSFAFLFLVSLGLKYMSSYLSSAKSLAASALVVYVVVVLMYLTRYPRWYFDRATFDSKGLRKVDAEHIQGKLTPQQREQIGYALPGKPVILVVEGKTYQVEKTDSGVVFYEQA
ncbi:MAG: hypothetical protein N3G22_02720 [Candidatus Micrarchaeota archaeon]|nr:hypothetical protein [Candidatus Micrarchaeota archaeon]